MNGPQLGLIIPAFFGCVWGIAGTISLSPGWRTGGVLASLLVSSLLVLAALLTPLRTTGSFDGTAFVWAVVFEIVFIVAAVVLLKRAGAQSFILPVVAVIVGLHFLGLWRATGDMSYVWLTATMCTVGFVAALLPLSARPSAAGIGSALSLWGATAIALLRA